MADDLTNETQDQSPAGEAGASEPSPPTASEASAASEPQADTADRAEAVAPAEPVAAAAPTAAATPARPGGPPSRRGQPRSRQPGRRGSQGGRSAPAEPGEIEDTVVKIYRCATVVRGGRRFSFSALVVAGDRMGRVGVGYGKANEVPSAVEKGSKIARRNMTTIRLKGTTIAHRVVGRYGASKVLMIPAGEGTGVIAGASVRAVMDLAGVKDVLTKSYGSNGPKNLVKAVFAGLQALRSKDEVSGLRGVSLG